MTMTENDQSSRRQTLIIGAYLLLSCLPPLTPPYVRFLFWVTIWHTRQKDRYIPLFAGSYLTLLCALSVRGRCLRLTSFRFHLAMDTLVSLAGQFPLLRSARDLHPLADIHASQTQKRFGLTTGSLFSDDQKGRTMQPNCAAIMPQ